MVIALIKRPLWREDGSVVYNCCWSSPTQSFSGPSPAGLVTTFYCIKFETPPTWRARPQYLYPPGTGWSSYTPRHWVPFLSPPTTRRATVELFDPAYKPLGTDQQKTVLLLFCMCLLVYPRDRYSTSPLARWLLSSNDFCLVVCFANFALQRVYTPQYVFQSNWNCVETNEICFFFSF
jgi:hypothetical protein